jgi:hypothetical protein
MKYKNWIGKLGHFYRCRREMMEGAEWSDRRGCPDHAYGSRRAALQVP